MSEALLTLPHAFPNQPRPHRKASHARGAVVGRTVEVCFEVMAQGLVRLRCFVDQ
jgi:hypothetical protein